MALKTVSNLEDFAEFYWSESWKGTRPTLSHIFVIFFSLPAGDELKRGPCRWLLIRAEMQNKNQNVKPDKMSLILSAHIAVGAPGQEPIFKLHVTWKSVFSTLKFFTSIASSIMVSYLVISTDCSSNTGLQIVVEHISLHTWDCATVVSTSF